APGPMLVPLFAGVARRVAHRVPVGRVAAAGSALVGAGAIVLLFSLGAQRSYFTDALPGWLLTGVGVGLALPTVLSSATADLPASRAATGSAIVNMSRQLGAVLGVSVLVALTGTPQTFAATHTAFVHARWAIAAAAFTGALAALRMTPRAARTLSATTTAGATASPAHDAP
ncbi:MAG: Drug resistance transporter, EmrB/QacA subfamily, partial [Streptomyces oryziradicis]|nr:Drug resistance transporter, EmrB/QacA subfamily [Actinacidiphila oryziradicis]